MTRSAALAVVGNLTTGALLALWLYAAWRGARAFHLAGMRRLHRHHQEEAHVARLRPGMRPLTSEEARELVRLQRALEEAAESWLSPAHRGARQELCVYVARLADDRVPLSHLADAMGVRKQRAHQQAVAGRAARASAAARPSP